MSAPLSSLKILDFSTLLPGPFASKTLADLGAEVLRVETSSRPDITRSFPANVKGGLNAHASLNRSKHSMLNLKHPEAVKIVNQLIKKYDIVLEPSSRRDGEQSITSNCANNLTHFVPLLDTVRQEATDTVPVMTSITWQFLGSAITVVVKMNCLYPLGYRWQMLQEVHIMWLWEFYLQ